MGCTHTCMPRVWWLWVILFFVQLLINVNTVVPSRAQRPIVLRCCRGECWLACSTLPSVLESPSFFLRHSRVYELAARIRAPAGHYYHHYYEGRPARALLQFNTASTWIRPPFSNQSRSVSLSLAASVFSYSWHYFSPALRDVSLFTPTSRMNIKQVPPWHRLPHMHMCIGMRSKFSLQQLALFQRYA